MSTRPASRRLLFLADIIKITPKSAKNGVKFSGLSIDTNMLLLSIPARLKIHAVKVVPMFAPKIMYRVPVNSIIPEFTSPTSITDVADDD